jgi:serine/threonine protein kinase
VRITEEKARMQQAWTIDESDLRMHEVIGMGAFGTVFAATWGHIPVAVKVLKMPLDDVNPLLSEDFDREVTFMQSIRHPNLLIFYGGGVNRNDQAFLVTELMEGGSLRKLLCDETQALDWLTRVSFAKDIARGMKYLHEKGTIHRDLKADNCFVDSNLRVKVADFGTGKIESKFDQVAHARTSTNATAIDALATSVAVRGASNRTLTKGIGTVLWMAPELLRGEKVSMGYVFRCVRCVLKI